MKFTIEGTRLSTSRLTPAAQKFLEYVQKMPNGELKTTARICEIVGYQTTTITAHTSAKVFLSHRVRYHSSVLWGNAKTIKEWKKQNGEE